MATNFNNPWVCLLLDQLWLCRQATEVMTKGIKPELMLDPKALTDYCLNPPERRLNPMEFHGKRRPQAGDRAKAPRARSRQGPYASTRGLEARHLRSSA